MAWTRENFLLQMMKKSLTADTSHFSIDTGEEKKPRQPTPLLYSVKDAWVPIASHTCCLSNQTFNEGFIDTRFNKSADEAVSFNRDHG